MTRNIDYKVPRTENSVLIDVNNWKTPDSTLIQASKINGKLSNTYITEVLDTNIKYKGINKGDYILISAVSSEIAPLRSYKRINNRKFFDLPIEQIQGVFQNKKICYKNLKIIKDKILIKKVENNTTGYLLTNSNMMLGEIVKIGEQVSKVKLGDLVIIRDNISTEIALDDGVYYSLEERMVVGILQGNSLENLKLINESILMKPYKPKKVLNSKLLITPDINYDELDYSDIDNRNLFKVEYADNNLGKIKRGDIILVNRCLTNYVYFDMDKYFIINGYENIEAKVEGDNE